MGSCEIEKLSHSLKLLISLNERPAKTGMKSPQLSKLLGRLGQSQRQDQDHDEMDKGGE